MEHPIYATGEKLEIFNLTASYAVM